jgi:hypothetical protein
MLKSKRRTARKSLGIVTNGRVPTLDEAKAQFKPSWSSVREHENERHKPPT